MSDHSNNVYQIAWESDKEQNPKSLPKKLEFLIMHHWLDSYHRRGLNPDPCTEIKWNCLTCNMQIKPFEEITPCKDGNA